MCNVNELVSQLTVTGWRELSLVFHFFLCIFVVCSSLLKCIFLLCMMDIKDMSNWFRPCVYLLQCLSPSDWLTISLTRYKQVKLISREGTTGRAIPHLACLQKWLFSCPACIRGCRVDRTRRPVATRLFCYMISWRNVNQPVSETQRMYGMSDCIWAWPNCFELFLAAGPR